MFEYEQVTELGLTTLKRTDEFGNVVWIPIDPTNSDYQEYLNPKAEQSTPIDTGDE
jgi:hypothetical protein